MPKKISIDIDICEGHACIKSERKSASQIAYMLANEELSLDKINARYSGLKKDDIAACLDYVNFLANEKMWLPTKKE